jgi:hypothetical protein
MADGRTKPELEETFDQLSDLVDDALDPELTREEVVSKLKEISDVLTGEEEDDLDDTDQDEEYFED